MEQIYADQLHPEALYDLVVASKQQEILAPNLPLLHRVQSVDGYGGGVLPLARYMTLQRLLLDEHEVSLDGRLREQLRAVPSPQLLDLLNIRYVITDKLLDVWIDDVYYDLQGSATVGADDSSGVTLRYVPALNATAVGVVSHLEGGGQIPNGQPIAEIVVTDGSGSQQRLLLRAGQHTSEGTLYASAKHDTARIAYSWPGFPSPREYLGLLDLDTPTTPVEITVRPLLATGQLVVRGMSLLDTRTGAHLPVTISESGRLSRVHSGDVKVYENIGLLPRAYIVHDAWTVPDDAGAMAALGHEAFDPRKTVVLTDPAAPMVSAGSSVDSFGESALVEVYQPERVVIRAALNRPGYLVVSDTHYPGWKVWADGSPHPIQQANLLFRAVALSEGDHLVEFRFEPDTLRWGAWITLASVIALAFRLVLVYLRRERASAGRNGPGDV
jgi:hypothetical protein